jgi:hypothetical protein
MIVSDKELVETDIVKNITCDCCGVSCAVGDPEDNQYEYMEMSSNWGYHSNKDLETWTAQICESCVDKHFSFIKFSKSGFGVHLKPD